MAEQWFTDTFGFREETFESTRSRFHWDETKCILTSLANNVQFNVGKFEYPTGSELDSRLVALKRSIDPAVLSDLGTLVEWKQDGGDIRSLIADPKNVGSVFQVASQFNCLEMVGPKVRPEDGISRYAVDDTQGPKCALMCPSATIFRNYFVNGHGQAGRGQLNLLHDVELTVDNKTHEYWKVTNGYCLPTSTATMASLAQRIGAEPSLADAISSSLRIGIHWDTEVKSKTKHKVCQVFSSALPVAYAKDTKSGDWEKFATAILIGAYESTLASGVILALERKCRVKVFLTRVGGGAFGNRQGWIDVAIEKAVLKHKEAPIDVIHVNYTGIAKCTRLPPRELKNKPVEKKRLSLHQYRLRQKQKPQRRLKLLPVAEKEKARLKRQGCHQPTNLLPSLK